MPSVQSNLISFLKSIIFVTLIFGYNYGYTNKENESKYEPINVPTSASFLDSNNNKLTLDRFEGKTVLLVFWATWCAPCSKEIPELDALQKDFRKLPFEVLTISQDFRDINVIKEYFKISEINYLNIYRDYKNELFNAFQVVGLPTAFIITPSGKVVYQFKGSVNWHDDNVRKIILSYIEGEHELPQNSYKPLLLKHSTSYVLQKKQTVTQQKQEEVKLQNQYSSSVVILKPQFDQYSLLGISLTPENLQKKFWQNHLFKQQ